MGKVTINHHAGHIGRRHGYASCIPPSSPPARRRAARCRRRPITAHRAPDGAAWVTPKEEITGHGFWAMAAAALLNEIGLWHPDATERQLIIDLTASILCTHRATDRFAEMAYCAMQMLQSAMPIALMYASWKCLTRISCWAARIGRATSGSVAFMPLWTCSIFSMSSSMI